MFLFATILFIIICSYFISGFWRGKHIFCKLFFIYYLYLYFLYIDEYVYL